MFVIPSAIVQAGSSEWVSEVILFLRCKSCMRAGITLIALAHLWNEAMGYGKGYLDEDRNLYYT